MCVLGLGVGLFYSAVTTAAVTALDPSRSSLAGGIVYMCQIAGGAIGLGLNTAIVLSADTLRHGITIAFRVDAALALAGFAVAAGFVRGARTSPAHAAAPAAHHRVQAGPRGGRGARGVGGGAGGAAGTSAKLSLCETGNPRPACQDRRADP